VGVVCVESHAGDPIGTHILGGRVALLVIGILVEIVAIQVVTVGPDGRALLGGRGEVVIGEGDDARRRLDAHQADRGVLGQNGVLQLDFPRRRARLQVLVVSEDHNSVWHIHVDLVVVVPGADHPVLVGQQQVLVGKLAGGLNPLGNPHPVVDFVGELGLIVQIIVQTIEHGRRRLGGHHGDVLGVPQIGYYILYGFTCFSAALLMGFSSVFQFFQGGGRERDVFITN